MDRFDLRSGRDAAEKTILCSGWKEQYVVVRFNKIWNTIIIGSMVVVTSNSHRGNPVQFPDEVKYNLLYCHKISV